jgi:hypothetical protein
MPIFDSFWPPEKIAENNCLFLVAEPWPSKMCHDYFRRPQLAAEFNNFRGGGACNPHGGIDD